MKNAHFIGIAGVGMSATALLLKEAGWTVTGSDAECYGPPREVLERGGISFSLGYDPKNISLDTDCFVIGRNAKLAPEENSEVRNALTSGKKIYSFPQMLGELTKGRENLVVAGSYGKSTVTALVAHILRHSGIDAGYFIGAEPVRTESLPAPASLGSAKQFILEGDEYPSSHDDSRAKFMHLSPRDVLLTSVVHDHINIYPTFVEYQKPFRDLLALVPNDGIVITSADEAGALALARESEKRVVTYGVTNEKSDYRATDISYGNRTRFVLTARGIVLGEIDISLLGAHNVENVVGAVAWILERNLASFEAIQSALADFKGIRRRLDNIAPASRVPVFEGFGSSYEKAHSAIRALTLHFPNKPLVIIFEPHTFGWRNRANLSWYDDVFTGAERIFVAVPETQGSGTHDQLSQDEILSRIGKTALPYVTPSKVLESLTGDEIVLILTSGSLDGTIEALSDVITKKFPI
ncbi:MAG: Mur ligase family protein [bacterium]|nr:Mur ligase family protein [bacterium]